MRKTLIVLLALVAAGAAQAQVQCWTTKDGRRECGDSPPPGAKVREIRGTTAAPAPPAAPSAKGAAAKDAKKGPLTPAEQEQAFRKRQIDAEKARDAEAKAQAEAAQKKENCERAREALRTLESGGRIARTDAQGERYFLDEAQVAAEIARARQAAQQSCT